MNDGDAGAEVFPSLGAIDGTVALGAGARRLFNDVDVLMPRFFRFRGFFAGVVGLASSKKVLGEDSPEPLSALRDLKSATKDVFNALATGDSGEGPGDGSVTEDESMVEMVVVGELSEDSEASVDVLSRWIWKAEKAALGRLRMFPLDAGRVIAPPCELVLRWCGISLIPLLFASSPKTDMKVGIGGANVLVLG
jgi:hypothetical protein